MSALTRPRQMDGPKDTLRIVISDIAIQAELIEKRAYGQT